MNCLRCARETTQQQVFCDACLSDMARHPVKSDTPIYLPVRKPQEAPRKQYRWHKKERTDEEMVVILRKRLRFVTAVCLVLFMLLSAAVIGVWMAKKQGAEIEIPNIGQNFQSVTDIFKDADEE